MSILNNNVGKGNKIQIIKNYQKLFLHLKLKLKNGFFVSINSKN